MINKPVFDYVLNQWGPAYLKALFENENVVKQLQQAQGDQDASVRVLFQLIFIIMNDTIVTYADANEKQLQEELNNAKETKHGIN